MIFTAIIINLAFKDVVSTCLMDTFQDNQARDWSSC